MKNPSGNSALKQFIVQNENRKDIFVIEKEATTNFIVVIGWPKMRHMPNTGEG